MSVPPDHPWQVCPACGATVPLAATCWLCYAKLPPATALGAVAPAAGSSHETRTAFHFNISTVFLTITLGLVLLGGFLLAPGMAILVTILSAPAFIRTCVLASRARRRGMPMGHSDRMATFTSTLSITIALLGLLAGAVIAAFFVYCAVDLSIHGLNIR